jgi:hypothetical protein
MDTAERWAFLSWREKAAARMWTWFVLVGVLGVPGCSGTISRPAAPSQVPASDFNGQAPTGPVLAPVIIEVSSFWEVLDQQVCPKIAAGAPAPAGVAAPSWTEVKQYCASPPSNRTALALAGQSDREGVLQLILTGRPAGQIDLTPACARAKPSLPSARSKDAELQRAVDALVALCAAPRGSMGELSSRISTFGDDLDHVSARTGTPVPPFLEQFGNDVAALVEASDAASRGVLSGLASGQALDGLASSILDSSLRGLAQFLVKRAELELRGYAIDKLRKVAQCDRDSVRHRLLVESCQFLGGETGTLPDGFGPGLRAAFGRDVAALPRRIVHEAPARGGPKQLLARVALEAGAILLEDPELMQLVIRLEVISHKEGAEAFVCSTAEPAACLEAKALLFLGATIAREILTDGKEIRGSGDNLLDRLRDRISRVLKAIPSSTDLHKALSQIDVQLTPAALAKWRQLTLQLRGDMDAAIASFREARRTLVVPANATPLQLAQAAAKALRHALRGVDRTFAIAECLKTVAVKQAPVACVGSPHRMPVRLADLLDAVAAQDFSAMAAAALDLIRGGLEKERVDSYLPPDMVRLLSFAAELANAKKPADAEAAIDAIAMPPGGWKEKRQRDFFSITGLVGAERIAGGAGGTSFSSSTVGAVGIDYNVHFKHSNWTAGPFVTVLDLGGLLNVRASETDELGMNDAGNVEKEKIAATSPAGFAQVFSPGIGLRLGLGESPLVAMIGAQLVPNGRSVTNDGGTPTDISDDVEEERTAYRFMFSVAVDVTLWGF